MMNTFFRHFARSFVLVVTLTGMVIMPLAVHAEGAPTSLPEPLEQAIFDHLMSAGPAAGFSACFAPWHVARIRGGRVSTW